MPSYGGSIAQNVYYVETQLCDPAEDFDGYPVSPDDDDNSDSAFPAPYILMVRRGGCTFVQKVSMCATLLLIMTKYSCSLIIVKVRNAQHLGASGVLIADNTCLCNDKACLAHQKEGDPTCEPTEPVMADDGSGADISIPSFLMYKVDALNLIMELKDNRPVQVEMAWNLPSPDSRVEYELWTTPLDPISKNFLESYKAVAGALKGHAYFTPHMYVHDGSKMGCTKEDKQRNDCHSLCTNEGRYCATDPDGDINKGISGANVVMESLRRLCIWNHYGAPTGMGEIWWDYVDAFVNRCSSDKTFSDETCIQGIYQTVGIDASVVDRCISDSGGLKGDLPNSKLDFEIRAQQENGVVILPMVYVNTAAVHGAVTTPNIFHAVCSAFSGESAPSVCSTCGMCDDIVSCVQNGGRCLASETPVAGVSSHTFVASLLLVLGSSVALGVWYYRRTQEALREHVRGIMAEYMPLDDEGTTELDIGTPLNYNLEKGIIRESDTTTSSLFDTNPSPPTDAFLPGPDAI